MNNDARIEELQNIIVEARQEIVKLDNNKIQDKVSEFEIGYYKRTNNYSCPESDEDYWTLYKKTCSVDKEGAVHCITFEKDIYNKSSIEQETHSIMHIDSFLSSYTKITEKEYTDAFEEFLTNIKKLGSI